MAERRRRKRKQKGGWLSRYDFAYAGRSTANQAADHVRKLAPKLIDKSFNRLRDLAPQVISQSSRELDAIAARRINQLTRTTANEIQRKCTCFILHTSNKVNLINFSTFARVV